MNFKEWINEGRRGPAAGAFGNDRERMHQNQLLKNPDAGRDMNRVMGFQQRVQFGKNIESKVIEALKRELGWEIEPPSAADDMYGKIDGWLVQAGHKVGIQVKYRDTGNDILFEVEKNDRPGRDMKSQADLYACLNKSGNVIRIRLAAEAKRIAQEMFKRLQVSGSKVVTTEKGQIRYQTDPENASIEKVVAYINPDAFTGAKKDINLSSAIWNVAA